MAFFWQPVPAMQAHAIIKRATATLPVKLHVSAA